MSRILIAVLALSAMGYFAYRAMYGRSSVPAGDVEAPTERLQNVKDAAKNIEQKGAQHVGDVDSKTNE